MFLNMPFYLMLAFLQSTFIHVLNLDKETEPIFLMLTFVELVSLPPTSCLL